MLNYTSLDDCDNFQGIGFVLQYNFTGLHTAPTFQSLADQALARHATNDPTITIKTTIAPLPITEIEKSFGQSEDAFLAWFLVSSQKALAFFPFCWFSQSIFVALCCKGGIKFSVYCRILCCICKFYQSQCGVTWFDS